MVEDIWIERDDVIEEWRKLQDGDLHNSYSQPNIIRMMKARRIRWTEHVACMGEKRNSYRALVGNLK
jgi:hypothetical protein